ncbi:MAG: hypothetical protein ACOYYU_06390 [Chloroflexota bacterium]
MLRVPQHAGEQRVFESWSRISPRPPAFEANPAGAVTDMAGVT